MVVVATDQTDAGRREETADSAPRRPEGVVAVGEQRGSIVGRHGGVCGRALSGRVCVCD